MRISFLDAVAMLQEGKVVAIPTETVYGLAASLAHPEAIEKIFHLKNRPRINPLIIHLANVEDIYPYIDMLPPFFKELTTLFWPGALTCVLPIKKSSIPHNVTASLATGGFRIPGLVLTRALIQKVGPLVMPSANLSGRPSSTKQEHVEADFGLNFPVMEGEGCSEGVESTIICYQEPEWVILRQGAIPGESFIPLLHYQPRFVEKHSKEAPISPGQLFRHYSPQTPLYIDTPAKESYYSHILGFNERHYDEGKRFISLGSLNHPKQVAQNLYTHLRLLDEEQAIGAWIDMDFPGHGLWETIAERLRRAAEKI